MKRLGAERQISGLELVPPALTVPARISTLKTGSQDQISNKNSRRLILSLPFKFIFQEPRLYLSQWVSKWKRVKNHSLDSRFTKLRADLCI